MPLLSKVCSVCGYVLEGGEQHFTATDSVSRLESLLYEIKALPQASFMRSMAPFALVVVPILTVLLVIAALISRAGLFLILAILFALWSIVLVMKKISGNLGNTHADHKFSQLKNDYELVHRTAQRDFGKNREVAHALDNLAMEFDRLERERYAFRLRNLIIWAVIAIAVCALAVKGVFTIQTVAEKVDKVAMEWQNVVKDYEAHPEDDLLFERRLQVISTVVKAGEMEVAETFFTEHCAGKRGDLECATVVVKAYLQDGKVEEAKRFVEPLTMRYPSDKKKLNNLITH